MRKSITRNTIVVSLATMMAVVTMTGCGKSASQSGASSAQTEGFEEIVEESVPMASATQENAAAETEEMMPVAEREEYTNANGWSVKYDPSAIIVNEGGAITTFVYSGDCAGTCMITVTYEAGKNAKTAADEFVNSKSDKGTAKECLFPGTEDVDGFYVDAFPGQMGPGFYETAFIRDYMEGFLMFEFTETMSGDDAMDIPVSDALSEIIDSLTFG